MTAFDSGDRIDLRALAGLDGASYELTIPDSGPPVRMTRLHVDRRSSASVALVRFPAGWTRALAGHYLCGEEFVVLAGCIAVGDQQYRQGDWAWLPPLSNRGVSSSPDGACALAWFSGPASWTAGPGEDGRALRGSLSVGTGRPELAGVPGRSYVVPDVGGSYASVDRDLLLPDRPSWAFVAAGRAAPDTTGLVLVREWS